jgi:hypothetical protein
MPLYFFSIENGERIPPDRGYEFPDDAIARYEAERIAGDLSTGRPEGARWTIIVTDDAGRVVATVQTNWVDY